MSLDDDADIEVIMNDINNVDDDDNEDNNHIEVIIPTVSEDLWVTCVESLEKLQLQLWRLNHEKRMHFQLRVSIETHI